VARRRARQTELPSFFAGIAETAEGKVAYYRGSEDTALIASALGG
jgi:hypothetical protein